MANNQATEQIEVASRVNVNVEITTPVLFNDDPVIRQIIDEAGAEWNRALSELSEYQSRDLGRRIGKRLADRGLPKVKTNLKAVVLKLDIMGEVEFGENSHKIIALDEAGEPSGDLAEAAARIRADFGDSMPESLREWFERAHELTKSDEVEGPKAEQPDPVKNPADEHTSYALIRALAKRYGIVD